jgi:hypothetical protein
MGAKDEINLHMFGRGNSEEQFFLQRETSFEENKKIK